MARMIQKGGGIRSNNTVLMTDPDTRKVSCILHQTVIAVYDPIHNSAELNTGGYDTPTTIRRMNECLVHWGFNTTVNKATFKKSDTHTVMKA
jgi:hypothetical protein